MANSKKQSTGQKLEVIRNNQDAVYKILVDILQTIRETLPKKTMAEYEVMQKEGLPVYMVYFKPGQYSIGGLAGSGVFVIDETLEATEQSYKNPHQDSK